MSRGKPTIVLKFNSFNDGYVTRSEVPLPTHLITALEDDMPRWRRNPPQKERLVCDGQLPEDFSHFSAALWWPNAEDKFGRQGLITIISRLYPPHWKEDPEGRMRDSNATLRAIDRLTEVLAELTTDLATTELRWPLVVAILSAMIDAEGATIQIEEQLARIRNPPKGSLTASVSPLKRIGQAAAVSVLVAVVLGASFLVRKTFRPPSTSSAVASKHNSKPVSPRPPAARTVNVDPQPPVAATIIADDVNVRAEPNTDADKIGHANSGDSYQYVSDTDGWTEVRLPTGTIGWIKSEFIKHE